MKIHFGKSADEASLEAAKAGITFLRQSLSSQGTATIILATGNSQLLMLQHLARLSAEQQTEIEWSKVDIFHLDEYIGLNNNHRASFVKYLNEKFLSKLKQRPNAFHAIQAKSTDPTDIQRECSRLQGLITKQPVDVCFLGIGENGHLAFNDPPCNSKTKDSYITVELDQDCKKSFLFSSPLQSRQSRKQQVGEGWFESLESVPKNAISMSIYQILQSKHIIATVPEARKASAVKNTFEASPRDEVPASYLRNHPSCWLYLDPVKSFLFSL